MLSIRKIGIDGLGRSGKMIRAKFGVSLRILYPEL